METVGKSSIHAKYIDVLDGIRALSVIFVLFFHFWQQTWIFPRISTPFLGFLGISAIDLTSLARAGYLFVDMMVLLSGFLLFLPLMRHLFLGEELASWKSYARKRVARIAPSYCFAVLVSFFFALSAGEYRSAGQALRDLVTHLTFTQTLFVDTYLQTKCGGVLWTVAIEVWFYVLFPLIAELLRPRPWLDRKKAVAASVVMAGAVYVFFQAVSGFWREAVVLRDGAYVPMYINQLPAFLGTYANGMLGAMLYVLIAKHLRRSGALSAACTLLSVLSLVYIASMVKECASLQSEQAQLWQVAERFRLTAAFTVFILSTALAAGWYRFLFSNRLMRFLAGISYNLYIWHQWLALQIKYSWRIPHWAGDVPPNQLGDRAWMNAYALIITVAAFAAAVLATYLIEKPFSRLILGKARSNNRAVRTGA